MRQLDRFHLQGKHCGLTHPTARSLNAEQLNSDRIFAFYVQFG
ncbi:MAG: hypothetical protein QQW96_11840 [Tychonema bourrellyi B0820]|nr:hypothetical protein [Tychonema bourrellyi]MDQ2098326.1 hypothetical protein [Tychonema bourrellyi B0820]